MTILRKAEHDALKKIRLSGRVLDLGGDKRSVYASLLEGDFEITTANMSPETRPDILCDLEQTLPISDAAYDGVLLINVLEHIFEYRQLLAETARVLKPGGTLVVVVPFLFPYHASPNDYHRYTATALERALRTAGFANNTITPLGTGVCSARWLLIERLLPQQLATLSVIVDPIVGMCDRLFLGLARILNKKYCASDYALGYVAVSHT